MTPRFLVSWGFSHILFCKACTSSRSLTNVILIWVIVYYFWHCLWGKIHLHILKLICSPLDLELLWPLLPEHWDCVCLPPHPVHAGLGLSQVFMQARQALYPQSCFSSLCVILRKESHRAKNCTRNLSCSELVSSLTGLWRWEILYRQVTCWGEDNSFS